MFHAFELDAYAKGDVAFARPLLDLGCGDGTFAAMLKDGGLLAAVDVGVEVDLGRLRHARAAGLSGPVQADARALPIAGGVVRSVLANSLLNAIPGPLDACLAEVERVLVPGGEFVLTVPAAGFDRARSLPRVLRALGARSAAARLQARTDRRLDEVQLRDEAEWRGALERSGFRVERVLRYFTPRQAAWTDLLSLQVFRAFAPLRLVRDGPLGRFAARLEERLFRRLLAAETRAAAETREPAAGGSILVVARKAGA